MLKGIVIHFMVIPVERQVFPGAGCLEKITCPPAKTGAAGHGSLRSAVCKFESFDNNIPGGTYNIESVRPSYFSTTNGLRLNGDWLGSRTLFVDGYIYTGRINAVGKDNDIA